MAKHVAAEETESSTFWKRMRYGAAAAVTLGSGIYAAASVLKRHGIVANIVDDVKIAMHTAPQLLQSGQVPNAPMHSADDEETRAVLNMQLQFAMQRQDVQRTQDISRQLDQLDEGRVHAPPHSDKRMDATPQSEPGMYSSTPALTHLRSQMPAQTPAPMPAPESMQTRMPTAMGTNVSAAGVQMGTSLPTDTQVSKPAPNSLMVRQKIEATAAQLPHNDAKKPAESELTPRQRAALQLKCGNIVEALDPVTGQWSPARIHNITRNGLIEVLWDDPGADAKGRPFHPIGEVWAEQIRVKRQTSPTLMMNSEARVIGEEAIIPPDGLQIGDNCFAAGTVIDKKWFHAKLISFRARSPPIRIEYISTLDGQTNELLLPSPRKDYVHIEQICRRRPEQMLDATQARRVVHNEKVDNSGEVTKHTVCTDKTEEKTDEEIHTTNNVADEDDVVITPDLMCAVCERPDDESNMLVCDCKRGYHTYCLNPPLDSVPEGDWYCPRCVRLGP